MSNKNKNKSGIVYSTNPDFVYDKNENNLSQKVPPQKQNLRVRLDSRMRNGKTVTLVEGFFGNDDDIEQLGKLLKTKCGVGGTVKDKVILIQGSFLDRVVKILLEEGYRVK